uniref:RWD domain-containing protein n=1 Tax=Spongospora subterranea TaxID=70186 RepID=A0A0H5R5D0_9EUKA|eukprot:CRZ03359.1 hypothetical protein [Spongospora subterranea]
MEMDFVEEQNMEMEALESIYMADFVQTSSTSCEIYLQPFTDDDSNVAVTLIAEFPSKYPSVIPSISIEINRGLNEYQRQQLVCLAHETAQNNVGSAMLFSVAEELKSWMMDNNVKLMTEHEQILERKMRREDQKHSRNVVQSDGGASDDDYCNVSESQAVQNGTMLTVENFNLWKEKFEREIKVVWEEEDKLNMDPEASKRMTGKKYFETHALSSVFLAAIEQECERDQGFTISSELYRTGAVDDDLS